MHAWKSLISTWGSGEGIEEVCFHRDLNAIGSAVRFNAWIQICASASLLHTHTHTVNDSDLWHACVITIHGMLIDGRSYCDITCWFVKSCLEIEKWNHYNTWMKKSLGFPTSDVQRSPRKSEVSTLSSIEPSVPKNTPSSPWLSKTQTKEAELLWSSLETEKQRVALKKKKEACEIESTVEGSVLI